MVHLTLSTLREGRLREYVMRFVVGGTITAVAGLIAKKFGPGIGGIFLAFPAILPASVTLIEKHVKEEKQEAGVEGSHRARAAACLDAAGAARGSIGLSAFAASVAWLIPSHRPPLVLAGSTLLWFAVAVGSWRLYKLKHRIIARRNRPEMHGVLSHKQ